jgi:hypothetical protein
MRTVYPTGTTIYDPGRCANGYTLLWSGGEPRLIDMNGRVVHRWAARVEGFTGDELHMQRAKLMPDGQLYMLVGNDQMGSAVASLAWDGSLRWCYHPTAGKAHHDFFVKPDGNVLLICREPVPQAIAETIRDMPRRGITVYGDVFIELTRENEVVWAWHQYDHLDINWFNPIPADRAWWAGPDNNTVSDWTHTNTIQALPENRWFDAGDRRFRPGNVLVSLRQLDTIQIIDVERGEVVWSYRGDYKGGLSGQHESCMIPKDRPGAGNILIFDNGASPYRNLAHAGCSFVLEIDPSANRVVWVYEDGERFHSNFTASCQRLLNGNTLICETTGARNFEVTPDGDIVWEYVGRPDHRSYRYPYDYCPQLATLGRPRELAVRPPETLTISPAEQ